MSRWKELFDNHPIHATLEWLRESASKEFDDIDENEVSEKRRFLKLISKFEEVLENLDPEITPFNQLTALNKALRNQNITNHINAYTQDGSVPNLVAASDILTTQLTPLSLLLSLTEDVPSQKPIKELEQLIDSSTSTLVDKKNSLSEQIQNLSTSVGEKEQKLTELSGQIDQKKTELNSLTSEWQNQFSSAQESRSQEFSKWRDSFSEEKHAEIDKLIQKNEEKFDASASNLKENIDNILTDGKEKHHAILELYELTAGDSVAAGYLKNAKTEKEEADRWRSYSVRFIIGTVCWLIAAFLYNTSYVLPSSSNDTINLENPAIKVESSTSAEEKATNKKKNSWLAMKLPKGSTMLLWYAFLVTVSVSGVLLWGSAYSAQQSTKHRNNEKRARWFALEVKAFDPFISSLEPAQRDELKKQLTERLFGQSANNMSDDTKVIDEHAFKVVERVITSILSKLQKMK